MVEIQLQVALMQRGEFLILLAEKNMIAESVPGESSFVQVSVQGEMGIIRLNRPEKRNALSADVISAIRRGLDDLHQEYRLRAVVITGQGDVFSSGTDLSELKAVADDNDAVNDWFEHVNNAKELLLAFIRFPKPIIAAVNGPAVGLGLGLVVASDIVIGSRSATFGVPEPRRGLVASLISPLLAFRIGGGRAAAMLLRAQTISAATAQDFGLLHECIAQDELLDRAKTITAEIAESAYEAISLTKRNLYEGVGSQLETLMSVGAASTATARTTEAALEGINAFIEKREPNWP